MAVPVKKTSKAQKNIRRHSQPKKVAGRSTCAQCGAIRVPHAVCTSCGFYNGRKVLEVGESL